MTKKRVIKSRFYFSAFLFFVAAGTMLSSGCAANPATGRKDFVLMSEAQELEIGRKMDPGIKKEYGVYADDRLQEYVSSVGQRISSVSHRPDVLSPA